MCVFQRFFEGGERRKRRRKNNIKGMASFFVTSQTDVETCERRIRASRSLTLSFFLLRSCLSFQKNVHNTRGFLPLKHLRFVIDCGFIGAVSVLLGRWSERPTSAEYLKSSFFLLLNSSGVCVQLHI